MTDIVPIDPALPPELAEQMLADAAKGDAEKGISAQAIDQLIPLLRVLQSNSPQCDKRGADYLDGAEPGHFWLRGAVKPICDGKAGIEVVPAIMQHSWVEWQPGRQGFVARHPSMPDDVEHRMVRDDSGRERPTLVRSNGNVIQENRDFFLLFEGQPFLMPCTSTFHTFAKEWNTYFGQIRYPAVTGPTLPAYARRYRLTTITAGNAFGKWFKPKFQDLGWVTVAAEYAAAKSLNDIVRRGMARVEIPLDGSVASPAPARQQPTASGHQQAPGVA